MDHQSKAMRAALASQEKRTAHVRHKCFISYHHEDDAEVASFIEEFSDAFIAKVLGVSDQDGDLIDSDDTNYVMRQIRERYLAESTVTIVMVGKCTWARKYVDWEIASTLRDDQQNKRSGLMGVTLPSAASYSGKKCPARLQANVLGGTGHDGYALWWKYPLTNLGLTKCIADAFAARDDVERVSKIDNSAVLFKNNRPCP